MPEFDFRHTDALTLMRSLPDASIDALISDPPYGTTQIEWDSFNQWPEFFVEARRVCKPDAPIVLFGAGMFTVDLICHARNIFRYRMVWEKTMPVGFLDANRRPLPSHEDIMVFCQRGYGTYNPQKTVSEKPIRTQTGQRRRGEATHYNPAADNPYYDDGTRYPTTIIKFKNGVKGGFHPTQKPVELMEYLIVQHSNKGETVLDPFSGSGTTGVAALQQGRKFIGCELNAEYHEKALKRMSAAPEKLFTGG